MNRRYGIASLIIVFIVTMILIFIVLVWQSRLLLVVHRSVGFADSLIAEYNAETEINNILGRFLGGFPIPAAGTKSLADGTVMTTEISSDSNVDTLTVIAKRQFATNRVQISRSKSTETSSTYDRVDIVLGIDCTRSMDNKADPTCTGSGCISRIAAARQAVLGFVDQALALPPEERVKYYIGIETFRMGAKWVSEPTNGLTTLRQQVADGLGDRIALSPACVISDPIIPGSGETSLGKVAVFADDYLNTTSDPRKKQIFIIVSDGLPNVSLTDARCGTADCRSPEGGYCTGEAIEYLTCGLASATTGWKPGYFGLRNDQVDDYVVTVMRAPSNPSELAAYNATTAVLNNPIYVKKYFNSENAESLPGILNNIFIDITSDVYQFKIQRVIPSLGP
jgi:hypothetical protein